MLSANAVPVIVGYGFGQANAPGARAIGDLQFIVNDVKSQVVSRFVDPNDWIHVPEVEGEPYGKFPIEWTPGEVQAFQNALDGIVDGLTELTGRSKGEINRQLLNANARPSLPPGGPAASVSDWITQADNLIALYHQEVAAAKPKVISKTPVIVGSILLGLGVMGAVAYAISQRR